MNDGVNFNSVFNLLGGLFNANGDRHARSEALPLDKKRVIVLHEADWSCVLCGDEATEVDHIWPRKWGGGDDFENLQAVCRSCNAKKGDGIYLRDITPSRCELRIPLEMDGARAWLTDASKWESIRRDIADDDTEPATAYNRYFGDDSGPPRPDATRKMLSDMWVSLLGETPGQAALDALAELEDFRIIDGDDALPASEVAP